MESIISADEERLKGKEDGGKMWENEEQGYVYLIRCIAENYKYLKPLASLYELDVTISAVLSTLLA